MTTSAHFYSKYLAVPYSFSTKFFFDQGYAYGANLDIIQPVLLFKSYQRGARITLKTFKIHLKEAYRFWTFLQR